MVAAAAAAAALPDGRPTVDFWADLVKPWPRQQQFLEATRTHEYTLFGGAAGPGKSYILRWWLLGLLLEWYAGLGLRGVRVGLFCEDYPSLKDRHLDKIAYEVPSWLGKLVHTPNPEFRLRPEYGGGVLAFRNLNDPSKYLSVEFAAIAVDELTRNPRGTFDALRFRKRWPGIEFSPFAAATNPGGVGHIFVKKLWIDRDFSGDDDETLDPAQFCFVPAKAGDNPALPRSYERTLASLPPLLRQAYRDGDWSLFEGQYFKEFKTGTHTYPVFALPDTWTERRVAVDFGYGAPWSCHFYARDETLWKRDKIVRWYVYREFYETHVLDDEQARRIARGIEVDLETCPQANFVAFADPAMFSKKPMQSVSVAEVYAQQGVPLNAAPNERVLGWQQVRHYLAPQQDGRPAVVYFETCREAIRTLPGLIHDRFHVDDIEQGPEVHDHAADELRYFCMSAGPLDFRREDVPTRREYRHTVRGGDGNGATSEEDPFAMFGHPQRGVPQGRTPAGVRGRR